METKNILESVQNLFETHFHDQQWASLIQQHFDKKFPDEDSIAQLPSLNHVPLHKLQHLSVVRIRCVVQDMFDPEFFLGAFEVADRLTGHTRMQCGMYRDVTDNSDEVDMNSVKNVTMQRQLLYCVSIPGENEWVKTCYGEKCPIIDAAGASNGVDGNHSRPKRPLESESVDRDAIPMDDVAMETGENPGGDTTTKRLKEHSNPTYSDSANRPMVDLNTPLPDPNAVGCIVKMYETSAGSIDVHLNEEFEFVGIITLDPSLAFPVSDQNDLMSADEDASAEDELPPSLVPRLHVLKAFKRSHNNPLLHMRDPVGGHAQVLDEGWCSEVRGHLHSVLEQLLWGDGLAADYLICHLLSNIYVRRDNAIGKFSLNLSRIPEAEKSTFPVLLYNLLATLVTKSHFLPLTIDNLNQLDLTPKKDYATNRVRSGRLQLSAHTHLVLDETALEPGQLDTKGVRNVTALGNLLRYQRVDYDFSYHTMEFPSDVPVLVLSEGRSMLPTDCVVVVRSAGQPQDGANRFAAVAQYLTPEVVRQIREYLTLNRLRDCTMPDDVQTMIQDYFVAERQRDPSTNAVTLHDWLVMARFLSLSYGLSSVNRSTWEKVKQLERQRMLRLSDRPTS